MRCGVMPARSWPLNCARPPAARQTPVITLNIVVLPEPFGPMRPRIAPLLTSRSSASSATRPPKRTLRPEQERSASLIWENSFGKIRSEEHTSELQSRLHLVCRLLLEKKQRHHKCIVSRNH